MTLDNKLERARQLLIQVYGKLLDAGLGSEPVVETLLVVVGQGGYLDQVKNLLRELPTDEKEEDGC